MVFSSKELFKAAYPTHDILDLAYTDTMVRIPSQEVALRHAENGKENTHIRIYSDKLSVLCSCRSAHNSVILLYELQHGGVEQKPCTKLQ